MVEETILIRKLREGDLTAFREIVENHKERIYYLARDLTGNHADAEDLSQEVFIKAFKSVQKFRGDAKISTWLYRITMNTFIDQKRKKKLQLFQKSEQMNSDQKMEMMANQVDEDQNPELTTEASFIQHHIEKSLEKLSPREKAVFVLRHYQDLSIKEIGDVLSIAEGTVKSLLFRAIKRLQQHLAFYKQDLGLEEKL